MSSTTMDQTVLISEVSNKEPGHTGETKQLAKALYIFAWLVEVIAVVAGLVISLMIGFEAFQEANAIKGEVLFSDYVNLIAAVIPFVLVAVVEATKIPVAGAAYRTRRLAWKLVFVATLLFLAGITFENMLNGLERSFSTLTYQINTSQKDKTRLEEQLGLYQEQKTEAQQLSVEWIEEQFNNHRTALVEERDNSRQPIEGRVAELRASVKNENVSLLENELEALNMEREALSGQHREAQAELNRRTEQQVISLSTESTEQRKWVESQIQSEGQRLESLIKDREQEIAKAGLFSKGDTAKRFDQDIAAVRTQIQLYRDQLKDMGGDDASNDVLKGLRQQFDEAERTYSEKSQNLQQRIDAKSKEVRLIRGQNEGTISSQLNAAFAELELIDNKFTEQQQENQEQRKARLDDLAHKAEKVDELNLKIEAASEKLATARNSINLAVGKNQVYRLAMRFTEVESAADVPNEIVTRVAVIWYGSLAAVVAFTGILLAFASYVVGDIGKTPDPSIQKRSGRLVRSLRRLAVDLRKRAREPKIEQVIVEKEVAREVIKEVPVDRVVLTEVPKEIVVKELVHVPLFTNDESLLYVRRTERNPSSPKAVGGL